MKVKKKKSNEISVSEFKSWISGIEDMQEADRLTALRDSVLEQTKD